MYPTFCLLGFRGRVDHEDQTLERPSRVWQVLGGRSKGGILVRHSSERLGGFWRVRLLKKDRQGAFTPMGWQGSI